ncbi:GDSL family lipase [Sporolactobacillus sp. THM7-7]|nr:GDSL family lipase [Sporolactobacillus sp. THM7-7]
MRQLICFGDSITAGWDGSRVRPALTKRLEKGLKGLWGVRNAGVPGDNTDQALARIRKDVLRHPYDRVAVLFGANDASFHKGLPIDSFRENLNVMIGEISPEKTILITPSPVIDTKQKGKRRNERIAAYAEVVRRAADKAGSPLIDLHARMTELHSYTKMLQKDGLHFTSLGYDLLSELIVTTITELEK